MRNRILLGTLAVLGMLGLTLQQSMAQTGVPPTISLSGDLTNAQAGLSTSPSMTFRLYSSPTGGSAIWSETQTVALIPNGQYKHFSVILGNSTPLTGIPFDQQYYVGVSVNSGTEITPRFQLPISPYAVRSHFADSVLSGLGDGVVTTAKLADGAVTSAKIADSTIVNADVSPSAAISYSKLNLTNSIANGDLTANSVTTSKVANGTVTTSKLADSAVSGLKLLTNAVTTAHIADGAVTLPKISTSGASSGQVLGYNGTNIIWTTGGATGAAGGDLSGTYPNPTIANDAVTSAKIADSTIVNADVSPTAAISYSKLALTNSIQNGDIVANAITTSKVANGTVTTSKLADSAVSGLKLLTYAVTNRHLAANSVTTDKIDPTGATSGQVLGYNGTNVVWTTGGASGTAGGDLTGTYPNPTIADSVITDANVSATAGIAYSKLSLTNHIQNSDIVANAITTSKVANGTVTTSKLADSAVSGLKLLTFAVTNRHLAANAVTPDKIDPSGATSGDVLTYNGTNVVWGSAGGSLSLPYSQTASTSSPLLSLSQTGASNVGSFVINNSGSVASVLNLNHNGIGNGLAIQLSNASNGGRGVDVTQSGVGPGVFATSAGGNAVWGVTSSISAAGVIGDNTFGEAVVGRNRGGNGVGAVVGRNDSSGYGVRGFNTKNGYGVLGQAGISGGTGTAGRFENVNAANTSDALQVVTNSSGNAARFTGNVVVNGNLTVSGTVAKGGGSFMIDHPLDPKNKILYHSFVESPDMKNIYDGVTNLDASGEAVVTLPNWFSALNGDFRYQLTAIGAQAPGLYVAEEIKDNQFKIAGGKPGMKVSWQVTGIRHDAWAEKHRIQVEVDKAPADRGTYLQPDAFGMDKSASSLNGKAASTTMSVSNAASSAPTTTPEAVRTGSAAVKARPQH